MFKTISEVKAANNALGHHFFAADTMRFFTSKIESTLYKNQHFLTSEKKCFRDYTRVYAVRKVNPDGSITTVKQQILTKQEAKTIALKQDFPS